MKTLKEKILESKGVDLDVTIYLDDFKNDFYNVLASLAFEYDKANKEISKDDWNDAFTWFNDKFFIDADNE